MNKTQIIIVSMYFLIFVCCVVLTLASDLLLGPSVGSKLADVSADGIKLTIAALLGALSTLLGSNK